MQHYRVRRAGTTALILEWNCDELGALASSAWFIYLIHNKTDDSILEPS
jgi:hypothetical protein